MLVNLILLFTVVPTVELMLLITIGSRIGVMPTIVIVLGTGIAGAFLAKLQGLMTLARIQAEVARGVMPAEAMFDGVIILCSGLLLLTPGFLTDVIGLLGLLPPVRYLLKQYLKKKINDMISGGKVITIKPIDPR